MRQTDDFWNELFFRSFPFNPAKKDDERIHGSGETTVLELDMPGVGKEDVTVQLKGGRLTVEWTRRGRLGKTEDFSRSWELKRDVKEAKAKLADGVLTVTLSCPEPSRTVAVE